MYHRLLSKAGCGWAWGLLVLLVFNGFLAFAEEETPKSDETPPVVIIEGQVTDSLGAGGNQVKVTVWRQSEDGSKGEMIGTAATDSKGDFKVRSSGVTKGTLVVEFEKESYALLSRIVEMTDQELPVFLGEELIGNLKLVGKVADAVSKRPIVNASVRLQAGFRDWNENSDGEGIFRFSGLSVGQGTITIEAEGFGRELRRVDIGPGRVVEIHQGRPVGRSKVEGEGATENPTSVRVDDGVQIVVDMKSERTVKLRVENELGQAVVGATAECLDERRQDFRTVVTNAEGEIFLKGVHFDAKELRVRLTHSDHTAGGEFQPNVMLPQDGVESSHTLKMDRAGRVTGLVTERKGGKPVDGARVSIGEDYDESMPHAWTDDVGAFVVTGVKAGEAIVTVHHADYGPELVRVSVEAGTRAEVSVQLQEGAVLKGVVKGDDGLPVGGALVAAGAWRGFHTLGLRTVTKADGSFELYNVPSDEFELGVISRGAAMTKMTVRGDAREPLEIKVARKSLEPGEKEIAWKVGDVVFDASLTTLEGETIALGSLKGKVVVLDFWATWCGPCVAEIPHLRAVLEKHGSRKDLVMISVSLDSEEDSLKSFISSRGMKWKHVFGGTATAAAEKFGVSFIPALFVIGMDGKFAAANLPGVELESQLDRLFAAKANGNKELSPK
ncbi:MAG: carboxypeptidase regulatory-like domain-containing protein [Planctomycetota bacterium]